MSKERLAEIIHKEAYLEGTNNLVMVINTDDYKWLIKQTERVQELENDNRVLKKVNVGSERAKERLRNWIDELEIENERYREALEYIGNHVNDSEWMSNVVDTKLIKAIIREALGESK